MLRFGYSLTSNKITTSNVLLISELNLIFVKNMRGSRAITLAAWALTRGTLAEDVGAIVLLRLVAPDDECPKVVVFFPMVESSPKPSNPPSTQKPSKLSG